MLSINYYFVGITAYNGRIFVFGGRKCCTEIYDPNTGRWTLSIAVSLDRFMFGVGVIKDEIYAVGGFLSNFVITDR